MARAICESLLERLAAQEEWAKPQKDSIPAEWIERQTINSHEVEFAVVRREVDAEGMLVIVRAFAPTWRFPNYFSLGGVGYVRADCVFR